MNKKKYKRRSIEWHRDPLNTDKKRGKRKNTQKRNGEKKNTKKSATRKKERALGG